MKRETKLALKRGVQNFKMEDETQCWNRTKLGM